MAPPIASTNTITVEVVSQELLREKAASARSFLAGGLLNRLREQR
jgi:hypothetical protein